MDSRPSLPSGVDAAQLRTACKAASDRIVERLPTLRDAGAVAHWTDATLEFMQFALPMIVDDCLAILEGKSTEMSRVSSLIYDFGADRARTGISPEQFLRIAVWTRREILHMFLEEIKDDVGPEVALALMWGVSSVTDDMITQHILGYSEELAARAIEDDHAFGQLLRTAHVGLALGDRDGNVVYVNDTFSRFLARGDTESIGAPWTQAFAVPNLQDILDRCSEGEEVWQDIPCVDEFGTTRTIRLSVRRHSGRIHAVAIDISYQVEFEHMRKEFLRGLIHDIRSPLTLIAGWANTLLQSGDRLDDDTHKRALESIVKAAHQVRGLTDHLLELDLLEGGDHSFDTVRFEAAGRIEDLVPKTDPACVAIQCIGATHVVCDLDAFDRIVTNLVSNAFDHGEVPVHITLAPEDPYLRIEVADSGAVDPDIIEQAFLGRVKSARGFGIGLRVTRLLTEALGGTLELTSRDPTAFTVRLPTHETVPR